MLILTYLLFFVALAVLLWVGTTWFQGYIYSEPAEQLYWRAPAAAAGITLFFAFWGMLAYRSPGDYPAMFQFTYHGDSKIFPKMKAIYPDQTIEVKRMERRYVDPQGKAMKSRPFAVVVEEDGEEIRFEADRDAKGYFIEDPDKKQLLYRDSKKRVMYENGLGELETSRWGLFFGNVLLNILHFAVWFVCCWLLLRYQWGHALGVAVVFWLIMTISISEMLVQRVERAKKEQPKPEVSQSLPMNHRMCMMSPSCTT